MRLVVSVGRYRCRDRGDMTGPADEQTLKQCDQSSSK